MVLTFADTYNMIAYLTKPDASEGFDQIINFLNASTIKYALTVNPNIYVSCIKQFLSSVSVKKVNDVIRLQALIDRKKVIVTEATFQEALRLNDAESIDCLPNKEIFIELSKMGYEKPSTKLTFYKAFFSTQWKFLIHTILQCMSGKRTSWNEFSSSMALAVICLSTGRKFNFSKYIFDSLMRNVDSSTKFYMKVEALEQDKVAQALEIIKLKQRVKKLERENKLKVCGLRRLRKVGTTQRVESSADTVMDDQEDASKQGEIIANIDADEDVTLKDVTAVKKTVEIEKDADVQGRPEDDELDPTNLKEVVKVVTTAKLMTEVVTAAATITTATTLITAAPSAARRRKGVVIRDLEETATPSIIIHSEPKSKDKGKGIMVEEHKPLKKQAQIEQDEAYARQALKRTSESLEEKAAKKQKLDKEVEEQKKHLQIVPNDDDYAYTEATLLALKVPIVDYEIYSENNKPFYKIIRADGSHQLFLRFLSLLRNFDREDLEVLWQLVKERFASSNPKNFSDDFLLTTLTYMFEKPDVQA
nr:hypothetical protein [Tanacetum cinerariifolium]